MKKYSLEDFTRGWIIGNFEPSLVKTEDFEIGILKHKKNEYWPKHFHKLADEYNVLLDGKMSINGELINKNEIFLIEKNETVKPEFLEDCVVLVIKIPSVIGDKYEV